MYRSKYIWNRRNSRETYSYAYVKLFLLFKKFYIKTLHTGTPVFVEQLSPQIRSLMKQDLLLRCQAISDELLDLGYTWTHNNIPLHNSNAELIGHIVSNYFFNNDLN